MEHWAKSPTARKPYGCMICGRRIDSGERYHRQFCVDGGETWSWVTCAHCEVMADKCMADAHPWFGEDGYCAQQIAEWCDENHPAVLKMAQNKWRKNGQLIAVEDIPWGDDGQD